MTSVMLATAVATVAAVAVTKMKTTMVAMSMEWIERPRKRRRGWR